MDTAQQLVDNNITLYEIPGAEIRKQFMARSPDPVYQKLAATMIIAKSWDDYKNITLDKVSFKGNIFEKLSSN